MLTILNLVGIDLTRNSDRDLDLELIIIITHIGVILIKGHTVTITITVELAVEVLLIDVIAVLDTSGPLLDVIIRRLEVGVGRTGDAEFLQTLPPRTGVIEGPEGQTVPPKVQIYG